jgi:hypothetical protein
MGEQSLEKIPQGFTMIKESVEAPPLTSVELLDAAVWREIDSEEAQPAAAFLEALARLLSRWLLVRSDTPQMDALTVLCKARGYIARQDP